MTMTFTESEIAFIVLQASSEAPLRSAQL